MVFCKVLPYQLSYFSFFRRNFSLVTLFSKKLKQKKISIFSKLYKENNQNNENVFKKYFWKALCFIMFTLSLSSNMLTLEDIFEFLSQKLKKTTWSFQNFIRDEVFKRLFFLFFIPGWIFIIVYLTGMNSSRGKISSHDGVKKHGNSNRHFTIDRGDFVQERFSS